jgi:hypothetical protein
MRRPRLQGRIHADFAFEPPFLSNAPSEQQNPNSKTPKFTRSISQTNNTHHYLHLPARTPRQIEPAGLIRETFFL